MSYLRYLSKILVLSPFCKKCASSAKSRFVFRASLSFTRVSLFFARQSVFLGNVNLSFRPSDSYRQKMNLNLVDQKHFNRSVVIAGFASYFMHSFDAGLGLVC